LLQDFELNSDEPLASQVYRILRDEIVAIRLRPGQLISEKEIAEVLKASKTPVREALIRLEIDGLVEIVPKSGTYVTAIRINKYMEACFTRLQLEIGAVRRAAERAAEPGFVEPLNRIIERQAEALEAEDYPQFFTLDQALHRTFFVIAGLPGVWELLLKTQADVNRMRHLKRITNIRRGPAVLKEHRAIIEAIGQQDPDGAERALVAHIGSLGREIEQLSSYPALLEFIENQSVPPRRTRPGRREAH
ncbi:MAG: GntR family transcriptional regulator, partial [Gammaproteobacteria bacterium]|nr:GntR family transcriptional regulator [Gammaproteobacteria bacterium]